jgi:hypothetical protein
MEWHGSLNGNGHDHLIAVFIECRTATCPGCERTLPATAFAKRVAHPTIKMVVDRWCADCRAKMDQERRAHEAAHRRAD